MEHLSLFELNQTIRQTLDKNLEASYWVVAEIGEMRLHQSGHCYLKLVEKEEDTVVARMRGTIWAYTFRNLSLWFENVTGQSLKKGLKILCNAQVRFHELYGLSLNIKDIDASFTLGERARRRQEIIEKLKEEGVFDLNRELILPEVSQRLAVVSSPSAAGFGDFMDQLENNTRGYHFHVELFKATMQGEKAAGSIINALLTIAGKAEQYDAMVVIRGGGSQLDLDCFDDYELAAHVAQFPLPVLTGIGHERDETITDLVAHTRLKTPTAVAEFLLGGMNAYEEKLDICFTRLYQGTNALIRLHEQQLINYHKQLHASAKSLLVQRNHSLELLLNHLKNGIKENLSHHNSKIDLLEKTLELLNPEIIMERGYTITTVNGKRLKAGMAKKGDELRTYLTGSIVSSKVEKIEELKT